MDSTRSANARRFSLRLTVVAFSLLLCFRLSQPVSAATVELTSSDIGNRWRDVAGHLYAESFRTSYTYAASTVMVTYSAGQTFSGHFSAQGLKPNFAYQLKFEGRTEPLPQHPSNALIGWHGRWWEEKWDGASWESVDNLNSKGVANGGLGEWPSPNDIDYVESRDIPEETSPTGRRYRYMAYRPFEYFITDHAGAAEFDFQVDSTYHVLWKTTQPHTHTIYDGRIIARTFSVDPAIHPAYDTPLAQTTTEIFGEWERLPMGEIDLLPGDYDCDIMLTEESFHGVDDFSGGWAPAVRGRAVFRILPAPTVITVR